MSAEELARRVEACVRKFKEPSWRTAEWRECCERWGAKSAPALGCLLALVRYAWFGVLTHGVRAGGVLIEGVCIRADGYNAAIGHYTVTVVNGPTVSGCFATEDEAMVCALEAAP